MKQKQIPLGINLQIVVSDSEKRFRRFYKGIMYMFLINSFKGRIRINRPVDTKELLKQLLIMLEKKNAQNVQLRENVISFKGPTIFFIYLGNPLYHFSKGNVCIKTVNNNITIAFEVCFKLYLIYCNIFSLIFSSFAIFFLPLERDVSSITKTGYIFIFAVIVFGVTHFIPTLTFYLMINGLKRKIYLKTLGSHLNRP